MLVLTRYQVKKPRYDALMAQGKGVLSSALAVRASVVGITSAWFSFRQDIDKWLKYELRGEAVSKIPGVSNMETSDTHMLDHILELGGEIVEIEEKDP